MMPECDAHFKIYKQESDLWLNYQRRLICEFDIKYQMDSKKMWTQWEMFYKSFLVVVNNIFISNWWKIEKNFVLFVRLFSGCSYSILVINSNCNLISSASFFLLCYFIFRHFLFSNENIQFRG